MLISKEVEVTLAGKWIKYYEDLGYEIPRVTREYKREGKGITKVTMCPIGTKIIVDIKDVQLGSSARVKCKCDNCGKITEMQYDKYIKQNTNGITYCYDCKSIRISGEKSFHWNPNLTQEEREIKRNYPEYTEWVKRVLKRDNYICKKCNDVKNKKLNVHHIDGYDWCKERRTDVSNGITLCEKCHKNFHMLYGRGNNTREQFVEWYKKPMDDIIGYDGKIPTTRPTICLETNEYIENISLYCKENNLNDASIRKSCNKHRPYLGKHYIYIDEYACMPKEQLEDIILDAESNTNVNKKIVQLDEKLNIVNIFKNIPNAEEFLGIKRYYSSIGTVAKHQDGRKRVCGYRWEYFDYYYKEIYNGNKTPIELLNKYLVRQLS